MKRRLLIGTAVLALIAPGAIWAQGEYTLEDLAAQVEVLALGVTTLFTAQDDLAKRLAAVETALAPTPTEAISATPTSLPAKPFVTIQRRMNIRRGPGTNHDILGTSETGTNFDITGRNLNGDWWQIDYEGKSAWVYAPFVTASHADDVKIVPTPTTRPTATLRPTRRPTSTRKPTRRPTPVPRPSPTPRATPGSLLNPIGTEYSYRMGDWQVSIYDYVADATRMVLRENIFNSSPPQGHRFVIVTIAAKYNGKGVSNILWTFTYRLKGRGNVLYDEGTCGVIPDDEMFTPDVLPGGVIRFNLCWTVPHQDAHAPILYIEPLFSFTKGGVWFEVSQ